MKLYLIFCFASLCLRFVALCILLAMSTYPRKSSYSAASDVFSLVWVVVFLAWAIKLLWL